MKHSDFRIGIEFTTGAGRWRCTDVGSRVIVAISLVRRDTVLSERDESGVTRETRYIIDDPRDLLGPPYSIAEEVFDEYDFEACELA